MVLNIQLREDQEQRVRQLAKERGVTPEEWAREVIMAKANQIPDDEFRRIADAAVRDNAELLRRLA